MSILKPAKDAKLEAMKAMSPIDDIGPQGKAEVFKKLPVNMPRKKAKLTKTFTE